ncbi:uncharacterized protein LOC129775858 isoform X2 [Toxorhynchites rutilus septentrionalis]|uniref:uncharacterized protein LOC129775858 isoform X2 n=1 Tax=Toxorhynchites rutilus septentrionalis TaxID=329112 RepID=UPI00247992EF|nr:uncharacterized protein LOC129775858 isoform X2 [Toxorhynchites rutilus septentrionalis]
MSGQEVSRIDSLKTVFTPVEEQELVDHILDMEVRCYGITTREIRSLAYQLAQKNGKAHVFKNKTQLAGRDWLRGFRKRHPELSLRAPEANSAARLQEFNRVAVKILFDVLTQTMAEGNFSPSRTFNVDESSILTVQTKRSKVLTLKGRRQVGSVTSAERGLLSTACICMSASGNFIPPMMIFPRARLTEALKKGAPLDTLFVCNSSGWMTMNEFNAWFEHFLHHTRPTAESSVLLLLDGHNSHTKNLTFLERARECFVTVVTLATPPPSPHCSHKLQPLDVSFMGPLKTAFSKSVEGYIKANPGKVVTLNEISELFGLAYIQAANAATAKNGFSATGIVPLNRFVFTDKDFAPADVTDVLSDNDPISDAPPGSREDGASAEVDTLECEPGPSHMVNRFFEG